MVVLPPLVAVVATARRVRAIDEVPEESTRTVRAARRIVLEAAVVLLAVLAVTTVRSRGAVIASGRTDWYAAVTPVLVALAAAVVALRVMPWPVAWLAGIAERGRGFVAFVGLTRAARTGAGAAVPLAALVVGATLVTLMATLTASVSEQRELAALRAVGADARVDAARIDTADVAALAARPGVEAAIPAHVDAGATVSADGRVTSVVVVAVDPARYAKLLEGTPLALTPPGAPVDGRLPVVLSGGPAVGDFDLGLRGLSTPAHRVATVPGLQRAVSGQGRVVALVPLDALVEALPTTQPNTVFLRASPEAQRALEATAARDRSQLGGLVTGVTTVTGFGAGVADRALPSLVAATFLVGVLLAGVLSFLAVLLLLAATRPERSQLAIRLRTMGLPHGRERRLAWAEVLPLLAVGVVAGCLVGVLVPTALAAALDLAPFTGAVTRLPIQPHPLTGLLVASGGARHRVAGPPDRRRVHPTRQPRRPPAQRRHRMTTSPARTRGRTRAPAPTEHDGPDILCDNLVRIFSSEGVEVVALQGLDLEVGRGELVAIVGASGSGKSTLLTILSGLDLPERRGRAGRGPRPAEHVDEGPPPLPPPHRGLPVPAGDRQPAALPHARSRTCSCR